jgi:hypothetical protein
VSNIDILPMGKKYSELVGDVSISDYKIYSEIMDKSDNDYNDLVNKHNYEEGLRFHKKVLGSESDYYDPSNPHSPIIRRRK